MAVLASLTHLLGTVLGILGQAFSVSGHAGPTGMILAGAMALALMAVVARMAQLKTQLVPVRMGAGRPDYPGPSTFRIADDPQTSGRPRPRAPSRSFSA